MGNCYSRQTYVNDIKKNKNKCATTKNNTNIITKNKYKKGKINFLENTIIFGNKNNENIIQVINNSDFKFNKKQYKIKNLKLFKFMSIVVVNENSILLLGGIDNFKIIYKNAYLINSRFNYYTISKMINSRYSFPSVLKDHYVYVIGGKGYLENKKSILKSCERLNLETLKWEPIADLNKNRLTSSSLIYNNKIYVFGGYTGTYKNSRSPKIERYNEELNTWEILDFKLFLGLEIDISFVSNDDNKILIFGGKSKKNIENTVYEIDLFSQTILHKTPLIYKRVLNHLIENKKKKQVLIIGGSENFNIETYNYKHFNSTITNKHNIIYDKSFTMSSVTKIVNFNKNNKFIHAICKNEFKNYNIVLGNDRSPFIILIHKYKDYSITLPVPLNIKLYNYQGIARIKPHKVILCGGLTINRFKVSNKVYILDLFKMKGKRIEDMPQNKYTFSTILLNNYVYCLGGRSYGNDSESILKDCSRYNLISKRWEKISCLNKKRCSSNAFIYEKEIYIAGGYNGENNIKRSDIIEKYDFIKNKWYCLGLNLNTPLEASLCHINKDDVYFFSGRTNFGDTNNIIKSNLKGDLDLGNFKIVKSYNLIWKRCLSNMFMYKNDLIFFGGCKNLENSDKLEKIDIINKKIKIIKLPNIEKEIQNNFFNNELYKKCSFDSSI